MAKLISLESFSNVPKEILYDLINQVIEHHDDYLDPDMAQTVFGGHGDLGHLSGSSSCEEVTNANLKNITSSLFSLNLPEQKKRSKIPKPKGDQKKAKHQEFIPKQALQIAYLNGHSMEFDEKLNARQKTIIAKKDAEIAKLQQIHLEQELEVGNLREQLKESEEKFKASSQQRKNLATLQAKLPMTLKLKKQCVEKEKIMAKKIENLELKVNSAEEKEKYTIADLEKSEKKVNNAQSKKIKTRLYEVISKLRRVETELEDVDQKNEYLEKKYQKRYKRKAKEEEAQIKQKYEAFTLWEDELRQREEGYKRNCSVKEIRDTLMELLVKRELRNEVID